MSSLTRRALLRRIAASTGGALLLPLMSKLTHAAQPVTPRFVFILAGHSARSSDGGHHQPGCDSQDHGCRQVVVFKLRSQVAAYRSVYPVCKYQGA